MAKVPQSTGISLTNIVVKKPIITKEQYDWILRRLELNKLNAKRNSKRDYLLRSMIHYEGDNLRYYCIDIRHKSWAYKYIPRSRNTDNPRTYLPGRKLEAEVEAKVGEILAGVQIGCESSPEGIRGLQGNPAFCSSRYSII